MSYFEQANLLVVPVQVAEYKGERIKYPNYDSNYRPGSQPRRLPWQVENSDKWVSWEEREEVYPGVTDWFALGGLVTRGRYFRDGNEIGYGVIDVDNHGDTERFNKTVAFLSSIGWDDTLIVQTPSGGRHYYFWGLADYLPNHSNGGGEYAIEFKTKGGWLVPNGRDRVIISDKPIKRLSLTKDSPFVGIAAIKRKKDLPPPRPTDPNFDISAVPVPDVAAGDRHRTLIQTMTRLIAKGCPPEKAEAWAKEFYRKTSRKEQPNEIRNAIRDATKYLNEETQENQQLVTQLKQEAENPLTGATPLTGWEGVWAVAQFSTPEEIYQLVTDTLAALPLTDEESTFVAELYTTDLSEMQKAWSRYPHLQAKFVYLKDTLKLALE